MQIFIPYEEPIQCAEVLYGDSRFKKQIIETVQIIHAISGKIAWSNHPISKMYKEHVDWLGYYLNCFICYRDYRKTNNLDFYNKAKEWNEMANLCKPSFITEELCNQHKRRLYTKNKEHYKLFSKFGESDENWYVIDGNIVKYINSKIVK